TSRNKMTVIKNPDTKASSTIFQNDFVLILFLLVFSLSLYTFKLDDCPFFNPDEGIHAQVAKNMVVDGDWITPRFNGQNFYDKPILYYWLNALSFKLFGINEFAARFPAALLGALGVLVTFLLGKALYDRRTGFMGAVILSVSFEYLFLSRLVVHDISLTFGILLSLSLFYYGSQQHKVPAWVIPLFYGSLAWSVLAKGPLGLVLPGMIIVPYILLTKSWRLIKELRPGLGMIIFLPLVAAWYVPVSLSNRDFLYYFIVHQHLQQFLSAAKATHHEPFYFYLPVFIGGFFPWSFFLPQALSLSLSPFNMLAKRKQDLFLILWLAIPFVFFSIASSKLNTYILPIYPAAAILVAKLLKDFLFSSAEKNRGLLFSFSALIAILIPASIALIIYYPSYVYIGLVLLSGTAISFYCFFSKKGGLSFVLLSATSAIIFLLITIFVMPSLVHDYSTKDLSGYLMQVSSPPDSIACYRRVQNSTVFYTGRLVTKVKNRAALSEYINQPGKWFLILDAKDYKKNQNEIENKARIIYREGEHLLLTNKKP
ncbi:MAG: glycosyltransferase family 39 protein, partial [Proteobacteria bacterium]|nr:glycosyltransferase family 39 protein [Pseudomonadota bacterium]